MVISILSLELSTCMRAHNYEVEVIAYQVGQYTREWWTARMTVDTCTQPPRHCCVPLPGFINCYRISQLDVVQSSFHRGTGNPVGCARWSLPLHIPSLHKLVLLVLCGKAREAQVGWTWLPARLLGLGFCFGQAIRFYYFFFLWKEYTEWFEFPGGWMARGLCDGLDETVVAFQLVSVSTGSDLPCWSRGFWITQKAHVPLGGRNIGLQACMKPWTVSAL